MSEINIGTIRVKQGLAQMLKGGVIVSKSENTVLHFHL
jgi:pyridoxal biosynthesis lyase PdxS